MLNAEKANNFGSIYVTTTAFTHKTLQRSKDDESIIVVPPFCVQSQTSERFQFISLTYPRRSLMYLIRLLLGTDKELGVRKTMHSVSRMLS